MDPLIALLPARAAIAAGNLGQLIALHIFQGVAEAAAATRPMKHFSVSQTRISPIGFICFRIRLIEEAYLSPASHLRSSCRKNGRLQATGIIKRHIRPL